MELNEGEIKCPECYGNKKITDPKLSYIYWITCPKCKGKGKLDWIENIVGKKEEFRLDFSVEYTIQYLTGSNSFFKNNIA